MRGLWEHMNYEERAVTVVFAVVVFLLGTALVLGLGLERLP